MRRLLIAGVVALTLTACSSTGTVVEAKTLSQPTQLNSKKALTNESVKLSGGTTLVAQLNFIKQQQRNAQKLVSNQVKIAKAVKKVKKYKGKTWYVFSGSSPAGWDCSGLVRWTYEQMGVTLPHSATKQMYSGTRVKEPRVGDIVAFYYPGSKSSFHVGLYIGDGKMIHSYRPGMRTRVESVSGVAKDNWAKYRFIRVLAQPSLETKPKPVEFGSNNS